jgi:hypothetical protein
VGELTCPLYSFTTFKEHFHDKVFEIIPWFGPTKVRQHL